MSDIILNQEQRKVLKGAVEEMVNSLYLSQAQKDLRKDIVKRMRAELEIPKKIFTSLSKRAYKQDATLLNLETTEILDLAEELGFYKHEEE